LGLDERDRGWSDDAGEEGRPLMLRSFLANVRSIRSASSAGSSAPISRAVSMNRRDCSGSSAFLGTDGLLAGIWACPEQLTDDGWAGAQNGDRREEDDDTDEGVACVGDEDKGDCERNSDRGGDHGKDESALGSRGFISGSFGLLSGPDCPEGGLIGSSGAHSCLWRDALWHQPAGRCYKEDGGGMPVPTAGDDARSAPVWTFYTGQASMSSPEIEDRAHLGAVPAALASGLTATEATAVSILLRYCLCRRSASLIPACPAESLVREAEARCSGSIATGRSLAA